MAQHVCYAVCHFISDDSYWKPPLKKLKNCFICQQPKRQRSTITEHMQPWPVWYPNSFLGAIGALGTGCLSCSLNTTALRGYGLAWHNGHLSWETPSPHMRMENHGARWYTMSMVTDPLVFSLPLTQSWTVQGVKKRCLSPHGQATKTWFTETSQIELSISFIFNKKGCKLMDE